MIIFIGIFRKKNFFFIAKNFKLSILLGMINLPQHLLEIFTRKFLRKKSLFKKNRVYFV